MDAIVTDVPEETKTKYDSDYEALVAKREAEASPVVEEEPETEEVEEVEQETKPEVPMIELVDSDGNTIKVPASARYRAKIDGQEVEVPFEQMSRSYQKGAAADKRLEEASRALKEIEAQKRDLTEREQAFLDSQKVLEKKRDEGKISSDAYHGAAKKLLAALTDEDETDPEEKIAQIFAEMDRSRQTINPDEIAAIAEKRAIAKMQEQERLRKTQTLEQERQKANKRFEAEYKDVIEDPIAYNAAKSLAVQKWQERPDAAPWEIASEVGNEVREWKKKLAPSSQTPKKPVTPKTVSARASIGQDPKPITRADLLAEMKAARGQPV